MYTGEKLYFLFSNPIVIACVFSWFCAQFIKTVIKLFYGQIHSFKQLFELLLWRTGGMPSSHSALVACLSTAIAYRSGVDSDIFILSLCFFLVTIRDAVGVRRANGIQAKRLNEIIKIMNEKKLSNFKPIKEVQGHSPMEVFVGCLLGFFIGTAFSVL
ncbi:divergent PAP2 family protein [Treponema parvum]|uniref:Divergent PAP2 family protein n=1 Tax=Treponema parvum TaxID=138851 RepID=A0A975IEP3_9SPIR|nr:divergent PAP2 family protein [Treponema parvum]QTQ14022.1 divergent PAP2 family protein [Treponema parvum]QTQ16232.1 divergent PAP2 family protein [Treponema parvum]